MLENRFIKYSVYARYQYWADYFWCTRNNSKKQRYSSSPCSSSFSLGVQHCYHISWFGQNDSRKKTQGWQESFMIRTTKFKYKWCNKERHIFHIWLLWFQQESGTKCCIFLWCTKASKARKTTPTLQSLLPPNESYTAGEEMN